MALDDLERRLASVGDSLATAGKTFERCGLSARTFGGDAGGGLGELGRQLYATWEAAALARAREAEAHAGRLATAAQTVRAAASGYDDVERANIDAGRGQGG